MAQRILQPNEQESPTTTAITVTKAPSAPPQVRSTDVEAPTLSCSSDEFESEEGEFEFPFVSRDSPAGTPAPADELFADGRIRPLYYPVFGRGHDGTAPPAPAAPRVVRGQLGRLFLEESRARNSSTSSTSSSWSTDDDDGAAGDGLEGAPPESYCLWAPGGGSSPRRPPRKSGSTGSMARWRRISELVVGRSHSDGKEKFVFMPKEAASSHQHDKPLKTKPSPESASGRKVSGEVDAHRTAYIAKGGGGTPRRTFLPYREELVGFFANVNGISRSHHHPF